MKRVAVLHPWLPQYRVPFFEAACDVLRGHGIELQVLHGTAPPEVAARGDARRTPWAVEVPTEFFHVAGRTLAVHRVERHFRGTDLVILEQAIRNIETYPALLRAAFGGPRVALWGHGRTYTKPTSAAEERAKRWLTRRASWFFAYTEGGADTVARNGFDRRRVTVVQNSIDTGALRRERARITRAGADALRSELGVVEGRTALYIGGLDADKRVPFLLEAADLIAAEIKGFRLLVAGTGDQAQLVGSAASRSSTVVPVGAVDTRRKAELAAVSELMLMPGRVGLAVVDSFALTVPMVTTRWPYHAPEFEYLRDGGNGVVTEDDVAVYAGEVVRLLQDRELMVLLAKGCDASAGVYTLAHMVENFTRGVLAALYA